MNMNKKIGVLSLPGTFQNYEQVLNNLNYQVIKVQQREDLEDIQGLIITDTDNQGSLLQGLGDKIKELATMDFPILGICSGLVLLSKGYRGNDNKHLGLMDLTVSKETRVGRIDAYISIPALGVDPVKGIFIDAPYIQEIAPNVGILAEYNGKIVFVRQGNMLASTFHPEQTDDRIYRYFLDIVNGQI